MNKTLPRLILIGNKDLSKSQAAAQSAHALAAFAIKYPKEFTQWNNEYIVLLRGDTEQVGMQMLSNIGHWTEEHRRDDVMLPLSACFREPDMDNIVTGWAILVTNKEELNFTEIMFGDLPLL